mmetsp:Transcript_12115/g.28277  ORF Transcript_12115/g.28277 Transcript_12115/m.28277 type:complete len:182 (+) Transcript_12115:32-577(+)
MLTAPRPHPLRATAPALKQQAACETVARVADAAVDSLNGDMRRVWQNQQRLETEMRALQRGSQQLCAQAQAWVHMYGSFHGALKALGDVENWADVLRRDMALVSGTIDIVQRARASEAQQRANEEDEEVYSPLALPARPEGPDSTLGASPSTLARPLEAEMQALSVRAASYGSIGSADGRR